MIVDRDRLLLMLDRMPPATTPTFARPSEPPGAKLTDLIGGVDDADEEVADFFAKGMLMTMLDAMQVFTDPDPVGRPTGRGARAKKYSRTVQASFFVVM